MLKTLHLPAKRNESVAIAEVVVFNLLLPAIGVALLAWITISVNWFSGLPSFGLGIVGGLFAKNRIDAIRG